MSATFQTTSFKHIYLRLGSGLRSANDRLIASSAAQRQIGSNWVIILLNLTIKSLALTAQTAAQTFQF